MHNILTELHKALLRTSLTLSALITGTQIHILPFYWACFKKRRRNKSLNNIGHLKYMLLSSNEFNSFKIAAKTELDKIKKQAIPNANTWAMNSRVYADLKKTPLKEHVEKIKNSTEFSKLMNLCFGQENNFEITHWSIWRNYPEKYGQSGKEVNSTFFHVDNGGGLSDRLHLNMFLYLSEVKEENGPFKFIDVTESKKVNRKYWKTIFLKYNLRSYELVDKISKDANVESAFLSPGEVLVIDNQICIHRAGYCSESYRDIFEIVFREKNY